MCPDGRPATSVDDWARREAEQYAYGDVYGDIQLAFRVGVASLADALLSDEAVEAAADQISDATEPGNWSMVARDALRAAIDAVTKGEGQ